MKVTRTFTDSSHDWSAEPSRGLTSVHRHQSHDYLYVSMSKHILELNNSLLPSEVIQDILPYYCSKNPVYLRN